MSYLFIVSISVGIVLCCGALVYSICDFVADSKKRCSEKAMKKNNDIVFDGLNEGFTYYAHISDDRSNYEIIIQGDKIKRSLWIDKVLWDTGKIDKSKLPGYIKTVQENIRKDELILSYSGRR